MRLPVAEREQRLAEYQVVEDDQGKIVGVLGFEICQRDARIHSEAFGDFSQADAARAKLWTRLNALAINHGVCRFWTQETAPFWSHNGLQSPTEELARKLPKPWEQLGGNWSVLKLKDEEAMASLDKEFAMFMEAERARTAETMEQARRLKTGITAIALIAGLVLISLAIFLFLSRQTGPLPPP
jgi:hypothetical protein